MPLRWRLRPLLSFGFAVVGAVASTTFVLATDTPAARAAVFDATIARTHADLALAGHAAIRAVYSAVPESPPTASATGPVLTALDQGLDPARRDGVLYPLRKGMEQLAGVFIFPLLLIGVIHALVTGRDTVDDKLRDLAINFFVVVALLWGYPLWDYLIYRQVAHPLTVALSNGDVVHAVVNQIAARGQVPAIGNDVTATFSPTGELSSFWQNDLACPVELSASSGADATAAARCDAPDIPASRRIMHARSMAGELSGSAAQRDSALSQMNPQAQSWWDEASRAITGVASGVFAVTSGATAPWVLGNIANWLTSSVAGILVTLESFLAGAVLWLVWLGVIVARAMSLTLAPIAIVWGLVPSASPFAKPKRWFAGHAKIALAPVGLSFGLLVFYAVQTAILATPIMTDAIIGLALKFALFLGLMAMSFKSATLLNLIAGDVTEVASSLGTAVRTRTVQLAGSTAALVTGAVAGGAGARLALSAAQAAGNASGAASGASGGSVPLTNAGQTVTGTAKAMGVSGTPASLATPLPETPFAKAKRKVAGVVRPVYHAVKWGWEQRVTDAHVQGGVASTMHASTLGPLERARAEVRTRRAMEQRAERAAAKANTARAMATSGDAGAAPDAAEGEPTAHVSRAERARRVAVAQAVDAAPSSVFERTVRRIDPGFGTVQRDESSDAFKRRMTDHGTRIMRVAAYLSKTPDERAALGLPREGGEREAATATAIDVAPWMAAESASALSPAETQSLRAAITMHTQEIDRMRARVTVDNGVRYGLSIGTYLRSGGAKELYFAQRGSRFAQILADHPELRDRQREAYALARQQIASDPALAAELPVRAPDESDDAYGDRVGPVIHRAMFLAPDAQKAA